MQISREVQAELSNFAAEMNMDADEILMKMIHLVRLMRGLTFTFHGISYKENYSADV